MFLAKRGTDFAPSFVSVCMVEGGSGAPEVKFWRAMYGRSQPLSEVVTIDSTPGGELRRTEK